MLFHTCGVPTYAAKTLTGTVQAVNNMATPVSNLSVIIDSISDSGTTFSTAPVGGNYGTVANGNDHSCASATMTWSFAQAATTNFNFIGHATGTVATLVSLASSFTTEAYILNNPVTGSGQGIDGSKHALSSNELNVSSAWPSGTIGLGNGVPFEMHFPSGSDVLNSVLVNSQVLALLDGNFSTLMPSSRSPAASAAAARARSTSPRNYTAGAPTVSSLSISDTGNALSSTVVATVAHTRDHHQQRHAGRRLERLRVQHRPRLVADGRLLHAPSTIVGSGGVQLVITLE